MNIMTRHNNFNGLMVIKAKREHLIVLGLSAALILIALLLKIFVYLPEGVNHYKKNEAEVISRQEMEVPIPLPKNQHAVPGLLVHTDYVGTEDHPTIDGGIINDVSGVPVNHDDPVIPLKNSLKQQSATNIQINEQISKVNLQQSTNSFQDSWATDIRVKKLLMLAAQQGKLDYVLKKSDQMGLPASVAVVPIVESHYNPNAISPKGAAGAWQLMPSTARDYGLSKNERFDFASATDAALKLLNQLHQQFGNWELAFAAYNAGSQRVQEALKKNPSARSIDDLDLPQETKTYVKRMSGFNKTLIGLPAHE